MRTLKRALMLSVLCAAVLHVDPALSKKNDEREQKEEVDYLELAALLLNDGYYDRAELALRQVNTKEKGVDRVRFYTLSGIVALKQGRYEQARQSFEASLKAGQKDPVIHLQLAQAYFGMKNYRATLSSLRRAGKAAVDVPAASLLEAEAHFNLAQTAQGFATLSAAARRFPNNREIERMRLFRLVQEALYQEALELGEAYLARANSPEDYLAFGEALRKGGQLAEAERVAETAHLRFPDHRDIALLLAHIELERDRPFVAGMVVESLASEQPEYLVEAAELYRRADRKTRALMLNARVLDQAKKLKQRLGIMVELEQFAQIAGLEPRLVRLNLLGDESIRYALAYSYFKLGDFAATERHLRQLRSAEMFERANQLRRAMQSCRERGWECT